MVLKVRAAAAIALFFIISVYPQAYNGYTLFGPHNSRYTYLVDMNNTVVKTWTHTKNGGYTYYLLEDGSVMRTAVASGGLNGGGAQGVVQRVDWNGNLLWEYTYSSSTYKAHHDIEPMPNGNVLIIAWEVKTAAQAVAAGLNHSSSIWPDHIIEVQPVGTNGGNIVWKWHFWDHLIQDYDPSKANYGVVANHPELLDINVGSTSGDWMHVNGISYNPELDQIVFSSHNLHELFVIDHSTTTAEAAGHTGGRWGKGGDILYRWGKASNYRATSAQVFKVVHCAVWVPKGLPGEGHIMAFNNREGQGTSMIVEIVPPVDSLGNYVFTPGTGYGPAAPYWSYTASWFYSNHLGGVQRLPNGNTIISESTSGNLFEVNQAGNTVWNYNRGGEIVRVLRYGMDYPGIRKINSGEIVINEFMASNDSIPDPAGEFDDWIELYNNTDDDITLSGRYLSNASGQPTKFRIPQRTVIKARDYLVVWADNDLTQGGIHANFDLSDAGGTLFLRNLNGSIIDTITFGTQTMGKSMSRIPNGTGQFTETNPTIGRENKLSNTVVLLNQGDIVINEFMTANDSIPDPAGEFEGWVELHNKSRGEVNIAGAFLTNDVSEGGKWQFPEGTVIPANGYLVVWLDDDTLQAGLHANFSFPVGQGMIGFMNRDSSVLDTVSFSDESTNLSYARIPNGTGSFVLAIPSIGKANTTVYSTVDPMGNRNVGYNLAQNYPNPFNPETKINFSIGVPGRVSLKVYDLLGNKVATLTDDFMNEGSYSVTFDGRGHPSGVYFYVLTSGEAKIAKKLTLLK
ncbi:MAG: lamin tail domain-containing protein [Ignavibacteriaceae bacterium]|nr:lamin tail domain-containing protein [Ignavibacteriaceae bacterium]